MIVDDEKLHDETASFIARHAAGNLADVSCKVELFDVYRGDSIAAGKKSLAYAIDYRSSSRTLTDAEVNQAFQALLDRLTKELHAEIRDGGA